SLGDVVHRVLGRPAAHSLFISSRRSATRSTPVRSRRVPGTALQGHVRDRGEELRLADGGALLALLGRALRGAEGVAAGGEQAADAGGECGVGGEEVNVVV